MSPVAERLDGYLAAHGRFVKTRGHAASAWLDERRNGGLKRFTEGGFPTTRNEDWRFTNVSPIADGDFALAEAPPRDAAALVGGVAFPGAVRVAIVNGRFTPELSAVSGLPAGLRVLSLREAVAGGEQAVRNHLASFALDRHPFAALNTAFLDDGVAVLIAPGTSVDLPIHIIVLTGADGPSVVSHPRTLLVAGAGSRVRVAQTFVGVPGAAAFTNAVAEVSVGDKAVVDFYTDQREPETAFHVGNLQAQVGAGGVFSSHAFSIGSRLMRHDIGVALRGEGGDCTMNGMYLVDGKRLMDTHTVLDHAMPHCTSHETYKGILAGKARGVFNGRIIVRQDAQKTDAKQTNRALLLSDDAQINSNPQLEIFADDVKCTHGATVGQLDDEAMFYLRARGLTPADARDMLLKAFAGEVLDGVKIPALRSQIESALFATLAKDLAAR